MHRHAFRSVCSRTRPELEQASDALRSCIRQFSTTQLQAADGKGPSDVANRGSPHSRSRNATSEINSLARSRSPARTDQAAPGPAGASRILDVKSLPRLSFRGRGGFRGRGARGGPQGDGPSYRGGRGGYGGDSPSFRGRGGYGAEGSSFRGRGAFGAEGSFRGRGGFGGIRGSRGGFGARGGRGRGGRGRGVRGGRGRGGRRDGEDKERKSRVKEFSKMDPDEQAFDDSIRFGVATQFDPSLTLESLADYAPVTPTSSAGKSAAVLQNLSVLGTADHLGAPQALQARHYATEIEAGGMRYFADTEARTAAEEHLQRKSKPAEPIEGEGKGEAQAATPIITDAEEAVRKVVLEKAVMGQHETPKFAMDPVGLSRSWHLRAETYTTNDVNTFENKLTSLLAKRGGKPAEKPKARA